MGESPVEMDDLVVLLSKLTSVPLYSNPNPSKCTGVRHQVQCILRHSDLSIRGQKSISITRMSISLCTASVTQSPSKIFMSFKNLNLRYQIYGRGHEFSVEFTGGGSAITAAFVFVCWLSKASRLSSTSVMPFVRSLGTFVQQNRATNSRVRYEGVRALWDNAVPAR